MTATAELATPSADTDLISTRPATGLAASPSTGPQARNALTFAMYERLAEICARGRTTTARSRSWSSPAPATRRSPPAPTSRSSGTSRGREDAHRLRGAHRPRARRARALPGADHRRDRRRLHRRRRRHRRRLRPAHRRGQTREVRLPDRPHARQLPVDGQLQPAGGADRPGAREGHHLHGPDGRGARRRSRSAC